MTGSMRYDQIDGYEPAPPDPPVGTWGYDGTQPEASVADESFQEFNPPPVEA